MSSIIQMIIFIKYIPFKYDMEAELMEAISANALSGMDESSTKNLHAFRAPEPGIVVYNTDGLENTTLDNFTDDIFDKSAHVKNNLITREQVSAGEPAFKLITSEIWNLLIPIDDKLAADLAEETSVKVEFKKDNSTVLQQNDTWKLSCCCLIPAA